MIYGPILTLTIIVSHIMWSKLESSAVRYLWQLQYSQIMWPPFGIQCIDEHGDKSKHKLKMFFLVFSHLERESREHEEPTTSEMAEETYSSKMYRNKGFGRYSGLKVEAVKKDRKKKLTLSKIVGGAENTAHPRVAAPELRPEFELVRAILPKASKSSFVYISFCLAFLPLIFLLPLPWVEAITQKNLEYYKADIELVDIQRDSIKSSGAILLV